MRRLLVLPALLAVALASPTAGAVTIGALPVRTGLAFPAAFAVSSAGRIYYGQRFTGEIRVFDPATGSDSHVYTISNVMIEGERGLLGIALHPQFAAGKPFLYAYATRKVGGKLRATPKNQILQVDLTNPQAPTGKVIFTSNVTAAQHHNGGIIHFGPDGKLYAQIGDAKNDANGQNLAVTAGKFVRMTDAGTIPPDNPFVGVAGANGYVYSFGFRNGYGFAFDPQTGYLFDSQNGPSCNDELNRVVAGGNYAWGPSETC